MGNTKKRFYISWSVTLSSTMYIHNYGKCVLLIKLQLITINDSSDYSTNAKGFGMHFCFRQMQRLLCLNKANNDNNRAEPTAVYVKVHVHVLS